VNEICLLTDGDGFVQCQTFELKEKLFIVLQSFDTESAQFLSKWLKATNFLFALDFGIAIASVKQTGCSL
jgi:hypothetical protein